MEYYVGLDVSLKETSICIVDKDGNVIKEGVALSDPDDIARRLSGFKDQVEHIGLEAGELSAWLCDGLGSHGYNAICIEARHAYAAMGAQRIKTDRSDAQGIAHMMRTGWFKQVHIKSEQSRRYRLLLNARKVLISKKQDINNTIRATLKSFGIKLGLVGADGFVVRVREVIADDIELQSYVEPLLKVRAVMIEQFEVLNAELAKIVKADPICQIWMEIPGVGPVASLSYKVALDDPKNFKSSRQVGAFLGLTPKKFASGDIDRSGRITKRGDGMTRTYLFEAAQVLMTRTKKDFALKRWGMRVAKRSTLKNAITAVARKLAVIMHAMWRDGTCFDQPIINLAKR